MVSNQQVFFTLYNVHYIIGEMIRIVKFAKKAKVMTGSVVMLADNSFMPAASSLIME
jgi:hypothetical protein